MVISACEESDGTEDSGRDCCTIICASKGTCLQTPSSLNPASPSCTQHHLHHAAQLLPEEATRLHACASSTASTSAPPVQTQQQENSPDSSDEHEALTPSSPSPSPAPLSHPHQYGASSTEQLEINNDCGAAQCSPPDTTTMAAISTVPSPSSSPASSSSDLHLRSPLSLLPSPTPPSTSSPAIDTGDTHSRPLIFRHSPREQKGAALNKKHSGSSAASLDPNAREFIPIAAPSSSLVLRFHQSQASSEADMAALHRQMGALNLDTAGTAKAHVVGYEPLHQPNREMGTMFYSTACPSHADVGYHSPCTGEVRFHNSQEGAYESHGYGATLYQAAWQMSYPVTPGQEGLARPEPAPLHNHVGLPSLSPAMAPSHAPQLVAATAMAVPPSLPSPSLYPTAGAMEAQIMSTLHSQKQFPPYQGPHANGSKEHVSRTLLISGLPPYISEAQLREELECWGAVRGIQADAHPQCLQVMVQFFDLRAARQALRDMQNMYIAHHHHQPQEAVFMSHGRTGVLCGNVVSAQYITSWGMSVPDAHNQGTLVLFNVGADVNTQDVRRTFEVYGNVREVREAPTKRQHKFVEFYDVRAAAAAWSALNGKEICGKCVKIEFSRQGGAMARRQKANQDKAHQEMIAGMGTNGAGMHGSLMNPCSWNGNTPTYGLSVYNAGLQPQGWEHWPSHEAVPPHFPVNLYVAGGPHGLAIPVYPEAGAHGDSNGKIGEKDVTPSGTRRVQHMQLHCGGGTGAKERIAGVSRIPKGHTHYQFDEDEMYSHPSNPRTTLMVQNIPNKYSQKMLLTMLDQHCLQFNSNLGAGEPEAAYDFMYLPIDFKNKCNLGYAFVNFTSPQATLAFYKTFHGKAWEEFNSRKICGVAFARLQGRPALEEHFKNSRFACDTEEYLPVLFVPPRNGCNQSQPRVAVGQGAGAVRGVRSGNGGRSYFSNDPCNQHEKAMSDTSSSSSPSTLSSVCEAEAKGVAQTSEPQDLAHPDMG